MEWHVFAGYLNCCVSFAKTVIAKTNCRGRPAIYKAYNSLSPRRTAFNTNAYVSMCVCIHTHICAYIYLHIYIYTLMQTNININMICTPVQVLRSSRAQVIIYIYIHTYICVYVCIYIYIYIYIYLRIYICIYIYI